MKNNCRFHVSDLLWEPIKKLILRWGFSLSLTRWRRRGRPPKDDRLMFEAMIYVLRTGIPWRDLPFCFGPWGSVYTRWRR